jgi:hypothetical protein
LKPGSAPGTAPSGWPLPWYGEMKRAEGAFATLLGLAFRRQPDLAEPDFWRAVAVGDSCLFQVRGSHIVVAFPLTRSVEFGSRPALIGSAEPAAGTPPPPVYQARGSWLPGDEFWLLTDALAHWFLRQHELGRRPWERLRPLADQGAFAALVDELRDQGELRNDDVTLLVAGYPAEPPPHKE